MPGTRAGFQVKKEQSDSQNKDKKINAIPSQNVSGSW